MNYEGMEPSIHNSTKFMSFVEKEEKPVKLKNKKSVLSNYSEMKKLNQTPFYSFDEIKEGYRMEKDNSEVEPYKLLGKENSTHS